MKVRCSCGKFAKKVNGRIVYPQHAHLYDRIFYLCKCGNFVGTHLESGNPLGIPADATTRKLRVAVHKAFDPIWKWNKRNISRGRAYQLLAQRLGIKSEDCHVGMFDIDTCKRAIFIIKYWDDYDRSPELFKVGAYLYSKGVHYKFTNNIRRYL